MSDGTIKKRGSNEAESFYLSTSNTPNFDKKTNGPNYFLLPDPRSVSPEARRKAGIKGGRQAEMNRRAKEVPITLPKAPWEKE